VHAAAAPGDLAATGTGGRAAHVEGLLELRERDWIQSIPPWVSCRAAARSARAASPARSSAGPGEPSLPAGRDPVLRGERQRPTAPDERGGAVEAGLVLGPQVHGIGVLARPVRRSGGRDRHDRQPGRLPRPPAARRRSPRTARGGRPYPPRRVRPSLRRSLDRDVEPATAQGRLAGGAHVRAVTARGGRPGDADAAGGPELGRELDLGTAVRQHLGDPALSSGG